MSKELTVENLLDAGMKHIREETGINAEASWTILQSGLDSLDLVEMCMAMEDEFGVEIPDPDDITPATTYQQLAEAVVKLVKGPK